MSKKKYANACRNKGCKFDTIEEQIECCYCEGLIGAHNCMYKPRHQKPNRLKIKLLDKTN